MVVRRPSVPGFMEVPYVVALVELPEQPGLRVLARLVDVDADAVEIGMPVSVEFEPLAGGDHHVPVFRLTQQPRGT